MRVHSTAEHADPFQRLLTTELDGADARTKEVRRAIEAMGQNWVKQLQSELARPSEDQEQSDAEVRDSIFTVKRCSSACIQLLEATAPEECIICHDAVVLGIITHCKVSDLHMEVNFSLTLNFAS